MSAIGLAVSVDTVDHVKWPYPFYILEEFGLNNNFMEWLKVVYNYPMAAVTITSDIGRLMSRNI